MLSPSSVIILSLFSKEQGSFRERRGRLLYPDLKQLGRHNWGRECVRMLRPDCFPAFQRSSCWEEGGGGLALSELRFYGGRKEEREAGVRCRGLDPSDGQLEPPRENARSGSGRLLDG